MLQRHSRRGISQAQTLVVMAIAGLSLVALATFTLSRRRTPDDIAASAREYLEQHGVQPLPAGWQESPLTEPVASLSHPLLGKAAPDFTLPGADGNSVMLRERWQDGPIVLVFYYGYYCNHCVAQLFALEADLAKFRSQGGQVIAISPDSPEETREKFAKYGSFSFPVLADAGNLTAAEYSLLLPRKSNAPQRLLHGTFIIDQEGRVRWCHYGPAPFTDNATLLQELIQLKSLNKNI
jgi:peroxiredoxin